VSSQHGRDDFDGIGRVAGTVKTCDRRIFDLWLACHTQEEIAEAENVTQQTVSLVLQETADLPKLVKSGAAASEHAVDFEPPLYNVRKQQTKTAGSGDFGKGISRLTGHEPSRGSRGSTSQQ
jgi:hypothetical protein